MKKLFIIVLLLLIASNAFAGTAAGRLLATLGTICSSSAPTTPVISVTAGNGKNTIALTSGGTGATSYNITWGTSAGNRPNTITGVTLPYTHSALTPAQPYYYVLVAINCGGSTSSSEGSGTPTTIWTNNVGKWALANTTYTDASSSGNNLSASGSPSAAAGHSAGSNLSTNFSGTPYLYHADNASLSITGNLTISFWAYMTSGSGTTQFLVSKNSSSGQYSYAIRSMSYISDNTIDFELSSDGTALTHAYSASTLSLNTWSHVVCVYNGTDMRIYINGTLSSNGSDNPKSYSSGIKDSTAQFVIGNNATGSYQWHGRIDDVAIWSRALSATEVTELYNATDDFGGLY